MHASSSPPAGLVRKHQLLPFLASYAQPGAVEDDILLEVVMYVGTLANASTAPLLVEAGLVATLFTLMGEKKDDDEFVLQIAFAFHKFLLHEETRACLLHTTQVGRGGVGASCAIARSAACIHFVRNGRAIVRSVVVGTNQLVIAAKTFVHNFFPSYVRM